MERVIGVFVIVLFFINRGGNIMKVFADALHRVIGKAIEENRVVGTSVIVAKNGDVLFEHHAGLADREKKSPVTEKTVFRLASMTKPIVSTVALALVEKGVLDLDVPINCWLPMFTPKLPNGENATITLRHLLTHTSGLAYGFLFADNEPYRSAGVSDGLDETVLSLSENLRRLSSVPLMFVPGSAWCYSLGIDVVGAILEEVCQEPLAKIVERYITGPLQMENTTFHVKNTDYLAQAYADSHDVGGKARLMQAQDQVLSPGGGAINFAPGRISNAQAYASGGSGMAGTARDYLKFLETIRQGGHPILHSGTTKFLTQDAIENLEGSAPGFGFSMGFAVLRNPNIAETPQSVGSYKWGGVYGTKMFVDPKMQLSAVMLTNTALEGTFGNFPMDIIRAIYASLAL
jgi:CubicO group peptidase (beta-lactamase class C family)